MSNPAPTLPPTLSADMLAKLQALIANLPAAQQSLVSAWAPGLVQIITDTANGSLAALYNKLVGITPNTLDAIHANMTGPELAAESAQLTPLFQAMAQNSYDSQQWAQRMIQGTLNAAITIALQVAGF